MQAEVKHQVIFKQNITITSTLSETRIKENAKGLSKFFLGIIKDKNRENKVKSHNTFIRPAGIKACISIFEKPYSVISASVVNIPVLADLISQYMQVSVSFKQELPELYNLVLTKERRIGR